MAREFLKNGSADYVTRFVYRKAFGLPAYSMRQLTSPLELDRVLVDIKGLVEELETQRDDDVESLMREIKAVKEDDLD